MKIVCFEIAPWERRHLTKALQRILDTTVANIAGFLNGSSTHLVLSHRL